MNARSAETESYGDRHRTPAQQMLKTRQSGVIWFFNESFVSRVRIVYVRIFNSFCSFCQWVFFLPLGDKCLPLLLLVLFCLKYLFFFLRFLFTHCHYLLDVIKLSCARLTLCTWSPLIEKKNCKWFYPRENKKIKLKCTSNNHV